MRPRGGRRIPRVWWRKRCRRSSKLKAQSSRKHRSSKNHPLCWESSAPALVLVAGADGARRSRRLTRTHVAPRSRPPGGRTRKRDECRAPFPPAPSSRAVPFTNNCGIHRAHELTSTPTGRGGKPSRDHGVGARPSGRRNVRPAQDERIFGRSRRTHQRVGGGRRSACWRRSLRVGVSAACRPRSGRPNCIVTV